MKINIILATIFLSVIMYGSADFLTGFVGGTQLNSDGCVCHALTASLNVDVWIEGPDTVAQGESAEYKVFLTGGPAISGGFNTASRFNDISPADTSVIEVDDELTHNSPKSFSSLTDTISWIFNYTALTEGWDTLYSTGNSVNGNGIPTGDEWNFGEKFPVFVTPPVPVELVSFTLKPIEKGINVTWITASELNNKGFEVQRSIDKENFLTAGFVNGNGTTTETSSYIFTDTPEKPGLYYYRLKQIDFDGTFSYSNVVSSEFIINSFLLSQNYPNPFNPATNISFSLPSDGNLALKIYDLKGELIEVLAEGFISQGNHSLKWDAASFPSGIYFYQVNFQSNDGLNISEVRKMVLSK
ncbi:MAG: T9SS C-terminal target domain-containing protein [Ignavibacteriales bacterium]|nr:MAG: T9SS C-terminal target domain-containing protein [Ignavibacteriales bacterium]